MKSRFDPETERHIAAEVERRMASRCREEKDRAIEELETSNQELLRANALLQSITTGTEELIAAEDGDFRYLFFNDAYQQEFKRLWGRDIEVGTSMVEAMAQWPEDQRQARELWRRALKGESFRVTMEFGSSEREKQIYDLRFNPVHDARGRQIGAAHILRNVTEQVRAQQALGESEKRVRSILESTTDGYLALDHEWRCTYFSERGARMLGVRREKLIGDCIWDLFPAARESKFYTEYHRAVETGQPVHFEEYYPGPLNMWLEVHGYPTDEGLTVFFRDISDRRQAEEVLRLSEERYRALVNASSQVLYRMSPDWSEMRQLHGGSFIADTEKPNRNWLREYIYSDDQKWVFEVIDNAVRTGTVFELEHRVRRADGSLGWAFSRAVPVRDAAGEIVEWFGAASDITERKQAELDRTRLIENLTRSNQELEQFAYIASHDLQTPLRAVTGFLDLLSRRYKGKLGPDADEFISFAVGGAERMHQLINDILAFSRVGTRGKPFERLESREPLERALDHLRHEIKKNQAKVITSGELPMISGDRNLLVQLFQNLVGNAIKYRKLDEPPRIHITAEEKEGAWEFRVRDNGIGFDPQFAERIFQIFQRLHTIDKYSGTGIGLAICKKIVERHGGRIWVESAPGKGSTFYFTLPKK